MIELINKLETKTSNGVLSKGWYSVNSIKKLVKGNSHSEAGKTTGYEPFSEVLVSVLLDVIGAPHVEYELDFACNYPEIHTYDCNWVSTCKMIDTRKQLVHYAQYADVLSGGECKDYFSFLIKHKDLAYGVYRMIAVDAIVGNSDRHLNNFDIMWDGKSATLAPIFDNGAALLSLISDKGIKDNWKGVGPDKAKPFKKTHADQVRLFRGRLGDIKLSHCNIDDIYREWEKRSSTVLELIDTKRAESIKSYLYNRLCEYSWMFGGNSK